PVEAGQHEVEHDQVGRPPAHGIEGGVAAAVHLDLEALAREVVAHHFGEVGLVLDHCDARRHGRNLARLRWCGDRLGAVFQDCRLWRCTMKEHHSEDYTEGTSRC